MKTLDERIAAAEAELERLKKERAEQRKFVPDDNYAFVYESYDISDLPLFHVGIGQETEAQAEAYAEWLRLHKMLADFAGRDGWKPDWSDLSQVKHALDWDYDAARPRGSECDYLSYGTNGIYFASDSEAKSALALLGDRVKFYLTFTIQGA